MAVSPSITGIWMSISTRSKLPARKLRQAWSPLTAWLTSAPNWLSIASTILRFSGWSSTTSTLRGRSGVLAEAGSDGGGLATMYAASSIQGCPATSPINRRIR